MGANPSTVNRAFRNLVRSGTKTAEFVKIEEHGLRGHVLQCAIAPNKSMERDTPSVTLLMPVVRRFSHTREKALLIGVFFLLTCSCSLMIIIIVKSVRQMTIG